MRPPNNKRARGRTNRRSPNPNRSYESNGPDGKIRGNANQVYDKYSQLARDASASGDIVTAEGFWQHAEHYYRIMMSMQQNRPPQQSQNQQGNNDGDEAEQDQPQGQQSQPQVQPQTPPQEATESQPDIADQEQLVVAEKASERPVAADDSDTAGLERAMRRSRPRKPRKPREAVPVAPEAEAAAPEPTPDREAAEDAAD